MILQVFDILDELQSMSDGNVSNRHDPVFDAPRGVHDGIDRPGEPRIRRWRQFVAVFLLGIVIGREIRDWNAG